MSMNIVDWNGFYSPFIKEYLLLRDQDTYSASLMKEHMHNFMLSVLENVKTKIEIDRNGYICFGGLRFKHYIINYQSEGNIKDFEKAFGLMNQDKQTFVTFTSNKWKVNAPVPENIYKGWRVIIKYQGDLINSNAPSHDPKSKQLIWTDKTVGDERIRFECCVP